MAAFHGRRTENSRPPLVLDLIRDLTERTFCAIFRFPRYSDVSTSSTFRLDTTLILAHSAVEEVQEPRISLGGQVSVQGHDVQGSRDARLRYFLIEVQRWPQIDLNPESLTGIILSPDEIWRLNRQESEVRLVVIIGFFFCQLYRVLYS